MLAIQKRLWRRLKQEIEASITENPPNVDIYKEEYERDLQSYVSVATKGEMVRAALQADVIYVGDYHTLPHAQKTLVRLLLALTKVRPEIVLCMEMVHIEHQPALDAFMKEEMSEEEFLAAIEYEARWGFSWQPYSEILAVARKRGVRVVAINSDPLEHEKDHLLERDFRTARVIVDQIRYHPNAMLVVFDGDLHVARDHLPLIVDTLLQRENIAKMDHLLVHQNSEEIYWQLARERLEHKVNVVRLADDAFCVLNASPIEKLQSYLNWVSEREELAAPLASSAWEIPEGFGELDEDDDEWDDEWDDDDDGRAAEYTEQVFAMATTVARFLGIERDDLDAFTLFTVNDLDFLEFCCQGDFNAKEVEDIKRQIIANESYFIPKGDIIYLADFSLQNAAEEASHFLHHRCSAYQWDKPRNLETDFYFRVVTEALGFFGSMIIVPTRECWTEEDCRAFVARHKEGFGSQSMQDTGILAAIALEKVEQIRRLELTYLASDLVLHHKRLERDFLASGEWPGAGKCLTQSVDVHLHLTHMLGHMLGDKLFWAVLSGVLDKSLVSEVFHDAVEEGSVALDRYLHLIRETKDVDHGPSQGERL